MSRFTLVVARARRQGVAHYRFSRSTWNASQALGCCRAAAPAWMC
jgi:hypothetical protein